MPTAFLARTLHLLAALPLLAAAPARSAEPAALPDLPGGLPTSLSGTEWKEITYVTRFIPGHLDPELVPDQPRPREEPMPTAVIEWRITPAADGSVSGSARLTSLNSGAPRIELPLSGTMSLGGCALAAGKRLRFDGVCSPQRMIGQLRLDRQSSLIHVVGTNISGQLAGWLAGRNQLGVVRTRLPQCALKAPQLGAALTAAAEQVESANTALRRLVERREHMDALRLHTFDRDLETADLSREEALLVWRARARQSLFGRPYDDRYVWSNIKRRGAIERLQAGGPAIAAAANDPEHQAAVKEALATLAAAVIAYDAAFAEAVQALPPDAGSIAPLAGLDLFGRGLENCVASLNNPLAIRTPGELAAATAARQDRFAEGVAAMAAAAPSATALEAQINSLRLSSLFADAPGREEALAAATQRLAALKAEEARLAEARAAHEAAVAEAAAAREAAARRERLARGELRNADIEGAIVQAHLDFWGDAVELDGNGNVVRRMLGAPMIIDRFEVSNTRCTGTAPQVRCQFTLNNPTWVFGLRMPSIPASLDQVFTVSADGRISAREYQDRLASRVASAADDARRPDVKPPGRAFGTPFEQVMERAACGRAC